MTLAPHYREMLAADCDIKEQVACVSLKRPGDFVKENPQ